MVAKKWIIVTALIIITITSGLYITLTPDSFKLTFDDGRTIAKYKDGVLKLYDGRNLVVSSEVKIYYREKGKRGYTLMKKKYASNKFSSMYYYEGENYFWARQDIYYSKGTLSRIFRIDKAGHIKESFNFVLDDEYKDLYLKFKIKYGDLDEGKGKVYLDASRSVVNKKAELDYGFILDWEKEFDNIVRVVRYDNGNLWLETRTYQGDVSFDPELLLEKEVKEVIEVKKKTIIDKYCKKFSKFNKWHRERCIVQYERDDFFPCYINKTVWGKIYCPAIEKEKIEKFSKFLSIGDSKLLLEKGVKTSLSKFNEKENKTEMVYINPLESYSGDVLQTGLIIGFGSNSFNITDFYYATPYNVSIDKNVTLTNLHTTQNQSNMVLYLKFTDDASDSRFKPSRK